MPETNFVSFVTFVRRALAIRGNTEHNGRGVYEMYLDEPVTWPIIVEKARKIEAKLKKQNLLTSSKFTDTEITIKGSYKRFGDYNMLCATVQSVKDGAVGVVMTMDSYDAKHPK